MNLKALTLATLVALSSPLLINTVQAEQPTATEVDQAFSAVQNQLTTYNQALARAYSRFLSSTQLFSDVNITTSSLSFSQGKGHATTQITFQLSPLFHAYLGHSASLAQRITLTFHDELSTLPDKQGTLAIDSRMVVDTQLKKMLDLTEEESKELATVLTYLTIHTELYPDKTVAQTITLKPFKNDSVHYLGLKYQSHFNEQTIQNGVGNGHLEFNGITIKSNDHDDKKESITFLPTTIDFAIEDNGNFQLSSSPIAVINQDNQSLFNIQKISGTGSNLKFDDDIAQFTGQIRYSIDEIKINQQSWPVPLLINSIILADNTYQNDGLYNFGESAEINIDGQSFQHIFNIALMPTALKINAAFEHIPSKLLPLIYSYYNKKNNQNKQEEILHSVLKLLVDNEVSMNLNSNIQSEKGSASIKVHANFLSKAMTDIQQWEQALDQENPDQFFRLVQESINFNISATIPAILLQALALEHSAQQFLVKDGDFYTLEIKNSGKGILFNGKDILSTTGTESAEDTQVK